MIGNYSLLVVGIWIVIAGCLWTALSRHEKWFPRIEFVNAVGWTLIGIGTARTPAQLGLFVPILLMALGSLIIAYTLRERTWPTGTPLRLFGAATILSGALIGCL